MTTCVASGIPSSLVARDTHKSTLMAVEVRAIRETWAPGCDGFLVFSTEVRVTPFEPPV